MSATSGPTYVTPFAQYDPDTQCWRTSEVTSLWALPMSLPTLPAWGGMRGGELFELPTPELLTIAPDCSSLPTPHAGLGERGRDGVYPNPKGQQDLQHALAYLPTPVVNDMGAGKDPLAWKEWAARQKSADGRPAPHGKSLEQELIGVSTPLQSSNGSHLPDLHLIPLFDEASATDSTPSLLSG